MTKRTVSTLILLFIIAALTWSQDIPFVKLTETEKAEILQGRSVFRQPNVWAELSVPPKAPFAKDLKEAVRKQGANYIGEVVMMVSRSEYPDFLKGLVRDLADVERHVGIPYWSKRNKHYYDLFDRMVILERSGTETEGALTTEQHMEPFDDYRSRYSWSLNGDRLSFLSTNLTPLSYGGRKAVSPGNLIWRLEAYADGDRWVLYGIGAVKAFDMFGLLRERLSASFMGRIEAFFGYMYGNGVEPTSGRESQD